MRPLQVRGITAQYTLCGCVSEDSIYSCGRHDDDRPGYSSQSRACREYDLQEVEPFSVWVWPRRQLCLERIYSMFFSNISVLNHTYTPMASRLLRVNILSPITGKSNALLDLTIYWWLHSSSSKFHRGEVGCRWRSVTGHLCHALQDWRRPLELINAEDLFTYVRDALKTLNKMDFDKLIAAV